MVKLHKKEDNVYESYSSCLEAQADLDRLKDFLGDEYFNKWKEIKDKLSGKDAKYKNIYDILKFDEDEVEELKDFLDNFQSKASKVKQNKEEGSKKVAEDEDYLVLKITSYKAAQKYGSGTKWCITGRYHGHEKEGEYWFNKYIDEENLDGGYYFYLPKDDYDDKYCILVTKDNDINSIWNAKDENQSIVPEEIIEVSENLPFYDSLENYRADVWKILNNAESFYDFAEATDYNFDYTERDDEGVPLGFKLLDYWEDETLEDLENTDNLSFIKEFLNMTTDSDENILDYVNPNSPDTLEFILTNGFDGSVDYYLENLHRHSSIEELFDIIEKNVDLSKIDKSTLEEAISHLPKDKALKYVDDMSNPTIIQLALNTDAWDVLDHLHKPLTKDDAERILGTMKVVANRPDLVTHVIDNNITNIEDIRGHHYIYWLLLGYLNELGDDKVFEKVIKYILQHKKVDTEKIIKDIEDNWKFSRTEREEAIDFFKSLLPKETAESMFYSSLEEAKQKDAGVIVKVGDYWRIKGNTVKYWPAKFKTREDALAALRAYHAQRNG